MKRTLMLLSVLLFGFLTTIGTAQRQQSAIIYAKHIEPTRGYPTLARMARIQGTVTLKLRIAPDGKVLAIESSADDPLLKQTPVLQKYAEEWVRPWTFGCTGCAEGVTFEHTLKVVFALKTPARAYDDTTVILNLPDEMLVTASLPLGG